MDASPEKDVTAFASQAPGGRIVLIVRLLPDLTVPWAYEPREGDEEGPAASFAATLEESLAALRGGRAAPPRIAHCAHVWTLDGDSVLVRECLKECPVPPHVALTGYTARVPRLRLVSLLAEAAGAVRRLIPDEVRLHDLRTAGCRAFEPEPPSRGYTVTVTLGGISEEKGWPNWSLCFTKGGPPQATGEGLICFRVDHPRDASLGEWQRIASGQTGIMVIRSREGAGTLGTLFSTAGLNSLEFTVAGLLVIAIPLGEVAPQLHKALNYAASLGLFGDPE